MSIDKMAEQAFMDYSMEVLKQRALPSVEDGCKPIHRRILFGMKDGGYLSSKPTRKAAKIVGEILGRFHPHGDCSVYDAMIRLAQPWKMRYPLVEVQGNMGNILGDKQAASRYTEARLTPIGELMTKDIQKECVPMSLNYSGEEYEPNYLTSEFPNSLVNPNLGIAVGMSSTTVPHNLTEICDAIIAYINSDYNLTTTGLLKYVKGPDFPTGGTIINSEDIPKIYETGKGTIKLRSKFRIETINDKKIIIITEVPYLISIEDKIFNKIKAMVTEEGYTDIENIQNHTGNNGFEIRIICAKEANINKVIRTLCDKTGFQTNISINNTVLVNGVPKSISFLEMIKYYIEFRHKIITKCAEFDSKKLKDKLHIIDGLILALSDIDNVISIIKSSKNKDEARNKLISAYNFSTIQVNAILDMKLSKLTSMETEDLKKEKEQIVAEINRLEEIIFNTNKARDREILKQIMYIKEKFGDKRRTELISLTDFSDTEEEKELINFIFDNNTVMPMVIEDKYNFKDKKKSSNIKFAFKTTNKETNYYFDKKGKIYVVNNNLLDIGIKNTLDNNDDLICALRGLDKKYLITISKNGIVKKSDIKDYLDIKRNSAAVKIRENDELFGVVLANDDDSLLLLGQNGGLVKINVNDIKISSRLTIGSKGIDDIVISYACGSEQDKVITISNDKIKSTLIEDYNYTAKGAKGQVITDNTTFINLITDEKCFIVYEDNKVDCIKVDKFATKGKTASGLKLSNSKIIYIAF